MVVVVDYAGMDDRRFTRRLLVSLGCSGMKAFTISHMLLYRVWELFDLSYLLSLCYSRCAWLPQATFSASTKRHRKNDGFM